MVRMAVRSIVQRNTVTGFMLISFRTQELSLFRRRVTMFGRMQFMFFFRKFCKGWRWGGLLDGVYRGLGGQYETGWRGGGFILIESFYLWRSGFGGFRFFGSSFSIIDKGDDGVGIRRKGFQGIYTVFFSFFRQSMI